MADNLTPQQQIKEAVIALHKLCKDNKKACLIMVDADNDNRLLSAYGKGQQLPHLVMDCLNQHPQLKIPLLAAIFPKQ